MPDDGFNSAFKGLKSPTRYNWRVRTPNKLEYNTQKHTTHSRHLDAHRVLSAGTTAVLQTVKEHCSFCTLVLLL
jgi:hypothetical protein